MAAHRIGARLSGLSPEQFVAFIEVLLSPDLAPHILAQLPTKEHAIKGTCRAWRRGWKETLKTRDRPRLLVIGGRGSDGEFLNSLERYDPSTNEWEEDAVAPMPTPRRYIGTAVLDGKFYAVGGVERNVGLSPSVERYDLATKAWEAVAPMGTTRANLAAVVLDGKLYAVGGFGGGYNGLSSVERYDPALNAWEAVAAMGTARGASAVAVLDGKLYAVGGESDDDSRLRSVERYDPATNAWEAVAPMAAPRCTHGVAVLDGKLYAVGGYDDYDGYLSSVERYDPAANVWEAVAPMATGRNRLAVAVLDGKLYAVGGTIYDDEAEAERSATTVERFDPATNAWEEVAPMATARAYHAVALLMEREGHTA